MTNKQRAMMQTMVMVGSSMLSGAITLLAFMYIPVEYIGMGLAAVVLGALLKTAYDINLSRLESLDKLNNRD